jgi:Cu/Ag efflux protein CusF
MKKLLILVFALALASTAFAQNKQTANYSGVVEKYDAATKTVTIKKKDRQGEFVITDTSEVLNNKAKADASAIAAGQKADVEFWLDGSKKLVKKLKLTGAATTK